MPITVEKLPDEPIMFVKVTAPYTVKEDVPMTLAEVKRHLDAATEPLWNVADAREFHIHFTDLVAILSMITRGDLAVMRHPNLAGAAIIANNDMLRLAANSLGQRQYGGINVKSFTTPEEALAHVRSRISEKA
jgi:hypothetical protein